MSQPLSQKIQEHNRTALRQFVEAKTNTRFVGNASFSVNSISYYDKTSKHHIPLDPNLKDVVVTEKNNGEWTIFSVALQAVIFCFSEASTIFQIMKCINGELIVEGKANPNTGKHDYKARFK